MKVILLGINASWTHCCLPLYYLRNALAGLDYTVEIIELTLKQTLQEALEVIYSAKPDVLCLSVYIWNVEYLTVILTEIRQLLPTTLVVAGGPEITCNTQSYAALKPDIVIRGYGEAAFRKLAGKGFQTEQKVIEGEQIPLQEIPFPYLETDNTLLQGKMVYYEASRGCSCQCIYCLSSRQEKMDWLTVERVFADIDRLLALQPKVIKFVDRSFNQNKEWARAIWNHLIELDTEIPFHFEIHPDWLEAEDITLLSRVPRGRMQFEIGIQSIHAATQKLICRFSDWNQVKTKLMALAAQTKIPLHVDLIAGLPEENLQHIRDSINAVFDTFPTELQLGFLKILAGTQMANLAKELGYLWTNTTPYLVLQTPDLTFEQILHLGKMALIINQYWNKGDFATVWKKAIHWREPYLCLTELLRLNLAHDNQLHSIDRVERFEIMSNWIELSWIGEQQEYLQDALKWDWCRKAGEAWYPDSIKANIAMDFRKEHYMEIEGWLKSEYWQMEGWNFKRFIILSAASDEFCREYLEGYTKAVFVHTSSTENAVVTYKKRY